MYYRYIKPAYSKSETAICASLNERTKQTGTKMLLNRNGKVYEFKFTVEQFATRRQAVEMFKKAQKQLAIYFTEV